MRKTKKVIRRIFTVIIILLFVFAASFVGFGYLVNKYTPEVDVQIGNNSNKEEEPVNIDNRLKEIQDEDNGVVEEEKEEETSKEEEEEIEEVLPKQAVEEEIKQEEPKTEQAPTTKAPIPQKSEIANQAAATSAPMPTNTRTKVFAGYYTSLEEAVGAQNELDSLLPDVSPFVKEMNGYYVVQIGVYANPTSATEMYNKVKALNFPVKTKSE